MEGGMKRGRDDRLIWASIGSSERLRMWEVSR